MRGCTQKPALGIVLGDHAGIGPEITLKMLRRPNSYSFARPVLIGNTYMLYRMAEFLGIDIIFAECTPENLREKLEDTNLVGVPVIDIPCDTEEIVLGKISRESGWLAYHSLVTGYRLLENNSIEGLVMAPINKEALAKSGCGFNSEYEVFAHLAGVNEVQSVVKGGDLFRSTVIGHVPFREILERLTPQRIVDTGMGLYRIIARITDHSPRICVAALNPHGGEGGVLGEEEAHIIVPAIRHLESIGVKAEGPFPCDTIYSRALNEKYDGIIYMYHDQGNIAMKAKIFETTALIYTNVPYTILSTGHGSAFDIAQLGIANPTNLCYVMSTVSNMLYAENHL